MSVYVYICIYIYSFDFMWLRLNEHIYIYIYSFSFINQGISTKDILAFSVLAFAFKSSSKIP